MFKPTSRCDGAAAARRGKPARRVAAATAAALLLSLPLGAFPQTDLSPLPLPTYSTGTTVDIKPNILMVLDDSGSMDWDYLPDWANDRPSNYDALPPYMTRNAAFNGVAYNPAVRYQPPVGFKNDGSKDTTTYPSMDGSGSTTGASTGFGSTYPNWKSVKRDGYGVQSTSKSDLSNDAYFYTTIAGEYCNSPALTNCVTASAPTGLYQYPAPLRWCNSTALTTCRGLQDSTYKYPRMPAPRIGTITFTNSSNKKFDSVTVTTGGVTHTITSSGVGSNASASSLATSLRDAINACTSSLSGNCTVAGFSAEVTNSTTVRIYASIATSATPVLSGTATYTAGAFDIQRIPEPNYIYGSSRSTDEIPGDVIRTVITPGINSYPFPGSTTKAQGRTDCAGTTCTYNEEMTNYANWFAYYRTRMQMMKTATSRAFSTLDSDADIAAGTTRYRVGYLTLNNNTGSDFVNLNDFTAGQKVTWFSKLFSARPVNGTPLRAALATAGRLYGGVLNGKKINNVTVTEPLQYSCQKNYTILSTDGFWNGGAGTKLDGSSSLGNIDGALPRPYNDGATAVLQTRTSRLQSRTGQLQKRTNSNYGSGSWSSWTNTGSCVKQLSGKNQTDCRTTYGNWGNVNACTASSSPDGSGKTTECQYASWSSWSNVVSCTPAPRSDGPNYTVGTARECQSSTSGGASNTLADVAAYYYNTDLRDSSATDADATGTCTGPTISPSTIANNLCTNNVPGYGRDTNPRQHMTTHTLGLGATGRMIFSPYQNDVDGNRVSVPDYWNQPSGDFFSVLNGSTASPSTGICTWMSSGTTCTWPTPSDDSPANIDDLWHAAVNGHGTYFSAQDPASLATALNAVLNQIVNTPRPGTAAAAASSNPNVTPADNYVFSSSYKSVEWYGELIMQRLNADGSRGPQQWSAMRLLDCATTTWAPNKQWQQGQSFKNAGTCYLVVSDYASLDTFNASGIDTENTLPLSGQPVTRNIYTVGTPSGSSTLIPFTWASLSATQKAYFETPYITYASAAQGLSQFCTVGPNCLGATAQAAASGQKLVEFLRGDRTNEGTYYRQRTHILGDIVSSEASYVRAPLPSYSDPGFSAYKTAMENRAPTVYVAANDGMLHAFNAQTGQERWAFVPPSVLPQIYRLADTDYENKHRYFVDGTPVTADICPTAPATPCDATTWKTILIGGLGQGGKSYYALDITDPLNPRYLWEFTDTHMGYTYGNPRIGKLANGTWAVFLTSGYNNDDGVGRLFALNAWTGQKIAGMPNGISTGVGTAAIPSGLSKISTFAAAPATDNTTLEIYGGDLLGNVWRFDVNDTVGVAGYDAHLLVTLKDGSGKPQPITAKPTLGSINGYPIVIVGTGRYLGISDLTTTNTNTMYAIKDKLDSTTLASPRDGLSNFVQQTMVEGDCPNTAPITVCQPGQIVRQFNTTNAVDWSVKNGWFIDFIGAGERSVTDLQLALGTLTFSTIRPQLSTPDAIIGCSGSDSSSGAVSYLYYLDYLTGGAVDGTKNVVGEQLCTCIATRPAVVRTQSGTLQGIIRTSGDSGGGGGGDGSGGSGDGGNAGGSTNPDAGGGGGGEACADHNAATCGDNVGSDLAGNKDQAIPYRPDGGPPRRTSWRELNGL